MNELELRLARLERQSPFRGLVAVAALSVALLGAAKGRVEPLVLSSEDGKAEVTLAASFHDGPDWAGVMATNGVGEATLSFVPGGKAHLQLQDGKQ